VETLFLIAAIGAAIHSYTYGHWLIKNGNKRGAIGVYAITVITVAVPLYRIMTAL
jgi:hypothetical protein